MPTAGVWLLARWVVIAAGLATGGWLSAHLPARRLPELPLVVGIYWVANAFASVQLTGGHRLSASMLVLLPVAAVRGGAGFVLPALAVAFGYRALRGEMDPVRTAYNVAQLTLSTLVGAAAFRVLLPRGDPSPPVLLGAALVAIAAYQVANTLFVALWRARDDRRPFLRLCWSVLSHDGQYPIWAIYSLWPLPALLVTEAHGYWGLAAASVAFLPAPYFLAIYGQLRHTQERLLVDELTQAYNYRYFAEWLRLKAPEFNRSRQPLAMLVIDVDDLKAVNDRFGHEAGNAVVRDLAERLRGQLRAGDAVVRFGGDEFIVLLPGLGRDDAERVAERLAEALREVAVTVEGAAIAYSATVGFAAFPDDADDVEDLFRLADERMYGVKGR